MDALVGVRLTKQAIEYAWRELSRRAGVPSGDPNGTGFEKLGVHLRYGELEAGVIGGPALVVIPSASEDWPRLLELQAGKIEVVPRRAVLPAGSRMEIRSPIPVLFRGAGTARGKRFAHRRPDGVVFECDLIASTVFMLSRWEEMVLTARDEHGRLPFSESVAYRQAFLDRPIIDEYALILREWLKDLMPSWMPEKRRFSVKLSHDIDAIRPFVSLSSAAKTIMGDLLKRRNLRQAKRDSRDAWVQTFAPQRTDYFRGVHRLAEISRRYGMQSVFNFMACDQGPYDSGYDSRSDCIRRCIYNLRSEGFEIGFHPSYRTVDDPDLMEAEKLRLDEISGETRYGGRQHYLRFRVPDTWRQWEWLGLSYDSTMTFAGHEGFRCGTCHPYRPFDLEGNRELNIVEIPLVVMDGTLRQYRHLTPLQAIVRVRELAQRCAAVQGTFSLLWHNSSFYGEWSGWSAAYERMVADLAALRVTTEDTNSRMDKRLGESALATLERQI